MSRLQRGSRGMALLVVLAVLVPSSGANAQGQTAFPLLSYRPVPPPATYLETRDQPDRTMAQDDIQYQRNPLLGAAIGAIIGAAAGYVANPGDNSDRSRGESALIGAAVGAGIGVVIGFFIKTPKDPEPSASAAIPNTLAVTPAEGGADVRLGWSYAW